MTKLPKLKNIKVKLNLPYIGGIEGDFTPNESEKLAAWEIYVELSTRVAVRPLGPNEGLVREALGSLHALFEIARSILRKYGPTVAVAKNNHVLSLGYITLAILNGAIRPVLSKWHPMLADYEATRTAQTSSFAHEQAWEHYTEVRSVLEQTRSTLSMYAEVLADIAGVPSNLHLLTRDSQTTESRSP